MQTSNKHVRNLHSPTKKKSNRPSEHTWRDLGYAPKIFSNHLRYIFIVFFNEYRQNNNEPSPSHHNFYRWHKLTIPSRGWFMTLISPTLYIQIQLKSSCVLVRSQQKPQFFIFALLNPINFTQQLPNRVPGAQRAAQPAQGPKVDEAIYAAQGWRCFVSNGKSNGAM